jgi:hypothetical protein
MEKLCVFDLKKICSNCGECDICDLNSNKKCNNCGKCLELEGYDTKAIKIDEIANNDFDEDSQTDTDISEDDLQNATLDQDSDAWELINDIAEVKDLFEKEELNANLFHEEYPGLIIVKKKH